MTENCSFDVDDVPTEAQGVVGDLETPRWSMTSLTTGAHRSLSWTPTPTQQKLRDRA